MARRKKKTTKALLSLCLVLVMSGVVYFEQDIRNLFDTNKQTQTVSYEIESIPDYNGSSYVVLENNQPDFSEGDYTPETFEEYSELDSLNRCGVAFANVGKETMPTEERGSIGQIKPSGWHTVKYDIVSGKYLYNRCHLIGYQLTGENANEKNLITCTRSMNQNNIKTNLKYNISYDGDYVTRIKSIETVETDSQDILDSYKTQIESIYSPYSDVDYYEYNVKVEDNKLTSTVDINYEKVDTDKLLEIDSANGQLIKDGKIKVNDIKSVYESLGAICEND